MIVKVSSLYLYYSRASIILVAESPCNLFFSHILVLLHLTNPNDPQGKPIAVSFDTDSVIFPVWIGNCDDFKSGLEI